MPTVPNSPIADQAFQFLRAARRVLVGAGAGLSAAAGLAYADPRFFDPLFPGYRERYGIQGAYEGAFFPFETPEELWAYWARHIGGIRYGTPAGPTYQHLRTLLGEKDFFVLTTNVDGQFEKSGFDRERLCTPQGDYAWFQCVKPCRQEIFSNEAWVRESLSRLPSGEFALPTELVPRCPFCGGPVFPNLRKDSTFVQEPWMDGYRRLGAWLQASDEPLVLLELGVGFNTPGVIRFPFETMMREEGATLIRINPDVRLRRPADGPVAFLPVAGDVGEVLSVWATRT